MRRLVGLSLIWLLFIFQVADAQQERQQNRRIVLGVMAGFYDRFSSRCGVQFGTDQRGFVINVGMSHFALAQDYSKDADEKQADEVGDPIDGEVRHHLDLSVGRYLEISRQAHTRLYIAVDLLHVTAYQKRYHALPVIDTSPYYFIKQSMREPLRLGVSIGLLFVTKKGLWPVVQLSFNQDFAGAYVGIAGAVW